LRSSFPHDFAQVSPSPRERRFGSHTRPDQRNIGPILSPSFSQILPPAADRPLTARREPPFGRQWQSLARFFFRPLPAANRDRSPRQAQRATIFVDQGLRTPTSTGFPSRPRRPHEPDLLTGPPADLDLTHYVPGASVASPHAGPFGRFLARFFDRFAPLWAPRRHPFSFATR